MERNSASARAGAALRALPWRTVLATQALACVFAVIPWLEAWHKPAQPPLLESLLRQAITALIVVWAAFAGDALARRGSSVWRAFAVVALAASGANVLVQSMLSYAWGRVESARALLDALDHFLSVAAVWGTFVMVFLNRRSARRLLTRVRAGELERVRAERSLTASRLAVAEAQIDAPALLRQLADVRDLYELGCPEAEPRFEALISGLRETLARSAVAEAREASR